MKPIDTLVRLGIVNAANGSRGVVYSLDEFPCHPMAVMSEDQVLSNNDVMAAVMGRCDLVRVEKIPNQEGWHRCVAHSGGTVGSCECNDGAAMTVILAGLQALEGE